MEVLIFKIPTDKDLENKLKICYQDINGLFSKIGIITDIIMVDGFKNYLINTSFGSYTANELRLLK